MQPKQMMCLNSNAHLNHFLLNQKDLESKTILPKIFCNMHIARHNRGLLYGTDLISVNLFCDVIFSLMKKLCYAQYINYNKNKRCKVTWWWSGSAHTVVNGSVLMQFFYFSSSIMYGLI